MPGIKIKAIRDQRGIKSVIQEGLSEEVASERRLKVEEVRVSAMPGERAFQVEGTWGWREPGVFRAVKEGQCDSSCRDMIEEMAGGRLLGPP